MKQIVVLFILFLNITALGQEAPKGLYVGYNFLKDPIKRGGIIFSAGYNRGKYSFFELNIGKGYRGNEGYAYVFSGYALGVEVSAGRNFILAPKISYSSSIAFLNLGANIIDYTDFKKQEFVVRPETGLTFLGIFSITYGYNISLNNSDLPVNTHNLAIKATFGKACWNNVFR